ncbi:hypothetical protein [Sphaerisporangium aureirubrum]|uniref:WD40 repeat domain-containing protein n=1 Tax=Sphaerisporangium aureirubrum TaxID=1544736 RepID=A0ABW1NKQ9_9ACTN
MIPDSLLPETLEDWAAEAQVPHGLADRALAGRAPRARRRSITMMLAAAATVVVVTVGMLVPRLLDGPPARPDPASPRYPVPTPVDVTTPVSPPTEVTPADLPASLDIQTDPENSPPKRLITAGRIAVSAYYVSGTEKIGKNSDRGHDTWYLYDPRTGTYEMTDWSNLDVAPGMKYAAVLERDLPARRVGILDMTTRELRWVALEQPATYVSWSPDGSRILVTSFDKDPSIRTGIRDGGNSWSVPRFRRLGFHIVDAASATATFHPVAGEAIGQPESAPFRWNLDGTLVSGPNLTRAMRPTKPEQPDRLYYDLDGRPHDAPERDVNPSSEVDYSPDGRLYAGVLQQKIPDAVRTLSPEDLEKLRAQGPRGPETFVTDVASGQVVGRQEMLQLRAWADDGHLVALQCLGTCRDEFDARLVVVTLDGSKSVRLSGEMLDSQRPGSWHPLLTRR